MMHGGGGGRGGGFTDDILQGKVYDSRLYKRLLKYLKPYLWLVVISFMILSVITVTELILPLITRSAIDNHIVSDKAMIVFDNQNQYMEFDERYHNLKLKTYILNGNTVVILPTRSRSKLDKPYLPAAQAQGGKSRTVNDIKRVPKTVDSALGAGGKSKPESEEKSFNNWLSN